jgi:selenophosphate synthetase-related protein
MKLEELVRDIRAYRGVVRKSPITNVAARLIPIQSEDVLAAYGEDAAVIKCGRELLLMAADGILQDLVNRNPFWAGYCAVLVNVNDIAAMGGKSIAMVNVLSCSHEEVRAKIVEGMRAACDKFGVPMVGGHLHPDTTYTAVDVAILGKTDRSRLVLSSGAGESDPIIFAMDLDGQFTEGVPYSWDTTSTRSPPTSQRGRTSATQGRLARWACFWKRAGKAASWTSRRYRSRKASTSFNGSRPIKAAGSW